MKNLQTFCKIFMWAAIGGFWGKALSTYVFYRQNPGLLEAMSAPWYAELLGPFLATIVLVVIAGVVRIILSKNERKQ